MVKKVKIKPLRWFWVICGGQQASFGLDRMKQQCSVAVPCITQIRGVSVAAVMKSVKIEAVFDHHALSPSMRFLDMPKSSPLIPRLPASRSVSSQPSRMSTLYLKALKTQRRRWGKIYLPQASICCKNNIQRYNNHRYKQVGNWMPTRSFLPKTYQLFRIGWISCVK